MPLKKMRYLFVVLEQQRVSRDAVDNLGPPSRARWNQHFEEQQRERENKKIGEKPMPKPMPMPKGKTGKNQK